MATPIQRVGVLVEALAENPASRIRDLAAHLGISKSSVHRLLRGLSAVGWVEKRAATNDYALTPKLARLGDLVASQFNFREEALPFLMRLARETGETVHLGVLKDGEVVYVERVDSFRPLNAGSRIGDRVPLWCTGIGKAILAHLGKEEQQALLSGLSLKAFTRRTITSRARLLRQFGVVCRRGYAIDDQEWCAGLISVAAPIRDRSGTVVAAASVAGPSDRMRPRVHQYGRRVVTLAQGVSARLGYEPPTPRGRAAPGRDARKAPEGG